MRPGARARSSRVPGIQRKRITSGKRVMEAGLVVTVEPLTRSPGPLFKRHVE